MALKGSKQHNDQRIYVILFVLLRSSLEVVLYRFMVAGHSEAGKPHFFPTMIGTSDTVVGQMAGLLV